LASDERERARRFHFERDQRRYIVRRGLLRTFLATYLGAEPARLQFRYGPFGKPELAQPWSPKALHFNLSDCGEVALYAFLRGTEVGVDIEQLRLLPDAEQISRRFFSAPENAVFRTVSDAQKEEAFFNCWTRKEAYIKAIGEGLSRPLDSFDVSLRPGEPAALLTVRGDSEEAARWSLHHLEPRPGYLGALAVPGHHWQLACWRYE
jgi:4'-phosphopantetheinyl transferase